MICARRILLLVAFCWCATLAAHEVRPAYLQVRQTAEEQFDIMWLVPAAGGFRFDVNVQLPPACESSDQALGWLEGGSYVERWAVHCDGGLAGQRVEIAGLDFTVIDVLVRFERLDGTTQIARVTPSDPGFMVTASETWSEMASTYSLLGVEHILLGIDHLLFVLALLLLVPNLRMLFWTITAFTLAHSLTLAAATLGWVNVPQAPVEAVIALSILLVATEIVHFRQGRTGVTRRWPWMVAFTFGLLHGFGFAGALSEIGLPEHAIPVALLFFNLGVEAGQLMFIAASLVVWAGLKRLRMPQWAWRIPVYAIGSMSAFWVIDRISAFGG